MHLEMQVAVRRETIMAVIDNADSQVGAITGGSEIGIIRRITCVGTGSKVTFLTHTISDLQACDAMVVSL